MKLSHTQNKEWGSKARKEQEALRGLTHTDARRAVAEGLTETQPDAYDLKVAAEEAEAARLWNEHMEQLAFEDERMWGYDLMEMFPSLLDEADGDRPEDWCDIYAGTADE